MTIGMQIQGQISKHCQGYLIDPEERLQLSHQIRQEVESFINAYIDDPSMGWPVISHHLQQVT